MTPADAIIIAALIAWLVSREAFHRRTLKRRGRQ
jgi:hypothetical protein